jgi:hypothetical protein
VQHSVARICISILPALTEDTLKRGYGKTAPIMLAFRNLRLDVDMVGLLIYAGWRLIQFTGTVYSVVRCALTNYGRAVYYLFAQDSIINNRKCHCELNSP